MPRKSSVRLGLAPAAADGTHILELVDVHTYYGNIHALKGVSLYVDRGEIVTLIGSNGAGKSTTLRAISGTHKPRMGSVKLEGREIHHLPAHEIVGLGIAHSPEGRKVFSRMSVYENLQMGAFSRRGEKIEDDGSAHEQIVAFLEKLNPCFKERHVESERPGQLLSADTFMVGALKGTGRVYLHAVVDTFGSYAFGFLHVSKQPEAAVAVLHNDVVPFYARLDLPISAVLTDNGREFCGTERHADELCLALDGIAAQPIAAAPVSVRCFMRSR